MSSSVLGWRVADQPFLRLPTKVLTTTSNGTVRPNGSKNTKSGASPTLAITSSRCCSTVPCRTS